MRVRKQWLVGGLAAVAVLAVAGAGAVMAQSADSGTGTFLDRVAQKLGIEPDKLEQAIEDTRKEDLDAAVKQGDITQEQADRLKERIDSDDWAGPFHHPGPFPPFVPGNGPFEGHGGFPGPHGFGFAFGLDIPRQIDDLAGFLGISADQLRQELAAEDATLATVAEAHGKSRDELKAFLTEELASKLDQAVTDGHVTKEMADGIKARAGAALDEIIDARFGLGRAGHYRFEWKHGQDGGEDEDRAAPAPQSGFERGAGRS